MGTFNDSARLPVSVKRWLSFGTAVPIATSLLLALAAPDAAGAQTLSRASIEQELQETRDSLGWLDFILRRADRGDIVISWPRDPTKWDETELSFIPISRDNLLNTVQMAVAEGEISAELAAALVIDWSRDSVTRVTLLRAQRAELVRREKELIALAAKPPAPLQPWEMGRPPATGSPVREETRISALGCVGFAGTWDTNWGSLEMTGDTSINGVYTWSSAVGGTRTDTLSGSVNGNVLEGTFSQPGFPQPNFVSGGIRFTLSPDGDSFTGDSWSSDGVQHAAWNGSCTSGPKPKQ